jgi:hypothetical protein
LIEDFYKLLNPRQDYRWILVNVGDMLGGVASSLAQALVDNQIKRETNNM